jgi:hypothetical protein
MKGPNHDVVLVLRSSLSQAPSVAPTMTNNLHVPVHSPRLGTTVCLSDSSPWPCRDVDAYWLPVAPPSDLFEDVPSCDLANAAGHTWGPWVLSPVYPLREDRFCIVCGEMEMQTVE